MVVPTQPKVVSKYYQLFHHHFVLFIQQSHLYWSKKGNLTHFSLKGAGNFPKIEAVTMQLEEEPLVGKILWTLNMSKHPFQLGCPGKHQGDTDTCPGS